MKKVELAPVFRTPRKDTILCQEVSRCQVLYVVDDSMHIPRPRRTLDNELCEYYLSDRNVRFSI